MVSEVLISGIGHLGAYVLSVAGGFGVCWWFLSDIVPAGRSTLVVMAAWLLVLCGIGYLAMTILTCKAPSRSWPEWDRGILHGVTMLVSCVVAGTCAGVMFARCQAGLLSVFSGTS